MLARLTDWLAGPTAKLWGAIILLAACSGLAVSSYFFLKAHWSMQEQVKQQAAVIDELRDGIKTSQVIAKAQITEQKQLGEQFKRLDRGIYTVNLKLAGVERQVRERKLRDGRKSDLLLNIYNQNVDCAASHLGEAGTCKVGVWHAQ